MSDSLVYTGIPSQDELAHCPGIPTAQRMSEGRVAVIECIQEIPCDPCEGSCPTGAIHIGEMITNLPVIDGDKCTGCGLCIARCPGLAITVINKAFGENETSLDFPFEYLPLPREGDIVDAVSRSGETVCKGTILKVSRLPAYGGTTVVRMVIPTDYADTVRSMKRLHDSREE